MLKYTNLDKKIDAYLGTTNLRPGPPKRLVNKTILKKELKENTEEIKKKEINFCVESKKLTKNIVWLIGVKKSDSESDGVYFLEFLNKQLLVLKACIDLPQIYFGTLFLKSMKIDTPNCRLIEYEDPEFSEMIISLEKVSTTNVKINNKIEYDLKERPFVIIFEYVPSLSFYEMGVTRASQIFKTENFKSREIFLSLGKILAVDVFFNNYDRIPFVWNNLGNPNNILFRVNTDLLSPNSNFKDSQFMDIFIENSVAIDTKPICLDPQDKNNLKSLGNYLNTISEVFKEFFYEMKNVMMIGKNIETYEFKCFNKICDFFKNSSGSLINNYNIFHMSLGFIIMLEDIIITDLESIQKLITFVQTKSIVHDWADVFKSNAKLLKINYFQYIQNLFKQFKEENEEIFRWVKEVTQDFYSVKFSEEVDKIIQEQILFVFSQKVSEIQNINKNESVTNINIKPVDENYDDFNMNKNDIKKFSNDVHNGIYDIFDIDSNLILEVQKFEYNIRENKEVDIPDIKKEETTIKKSLDVKVIEELDPHQTYTLDELKDKIKKDELKQTLFMKKKLNPDEGKILEDKIKNVDENFLEEAEEEKKQNELEKSKDEERKNKLFGK